MQKHFGEILWWKQWHCLLPCCPKNPNVDALSINPTLTGICRARDREEQGGDVPQDRRLPGRGQGEGGRHLGERHNHLLPFRLATLANLCTWCSHQIVMVVHNLLIMPKLMFCHSSIASSTKT